MESKPQITTGNRARNILKRVGVPTEEPTVQQSVAVPTPPAEVDNTKVKDEFDVDVDAPPVIEKKEEKVKLSEQQSSGLQLDSDDELDGLIDPKGSTGENFKRFRTKLKSFKNDNKTLATENETLKNKIKEYDEGLSVPELTQNQIRRIEELEVYERLYNFEKSPVAQAKFVNPIRREQEALKNLAAEHEVSTEVLNAAFAESSSVKQDEILSKHFKTTVGAIEAKNILKNIKGIQQEYDLAKKDPVVSLQRMEEENDRIASENRARANEVIAGVSKEGWLESLHHLRADNRFKEIQYSTTDTEHNEKFVRPILTKAGQEYGKTVRMLVENGLTSLPKELAVKLARSDKLAVYSAALLAQKEQLASRVAELEALIKNKTVLNRPGVNSTSGGSNVNFTIPRANGAQNAGRRILERVSSRRA